MVRILAKKFYKKFMLITILSIFIKFNYFLISNLVGQFKYFEMMVIKKIKVEKEKKYKKRLLEINKNISEK